MYKELDNVIVESNINITYFDEIINFKSFIYFY